MTNCPNCGAPVDLGSVKCPYCDTPYANVRTETLYADNEPVMSLYESGLITANEARLRMGMEELRNAKAIEDLYSSAIKAMRGYSGEV